VAAPPISTFRRRRRPVSFPHAARDAATAGIAGAYNGGKPVGSPSNEAERPAGGSGSMR